MTMTPKRLASLTLPRTPVLPSEMGLAADGVQMLHSSYSQDFEDYLLYEGLLDGTPSKMGVFLRPKFDTDTSHSVNESTGSYGRTTGGYRLRNSSAAEERVYGEFTASFPVQYGDRFDANWWVKQDDVTRGTSGVGIAFYRDKECTDYLANNSSGAASTAVATWQQFSGTFVCGHQEAKYARIILYSDRYGSGNGEYAYFDDILVKRTGTEGNNYVGPWYGPGIIRSTDDSFNGAASMKVSAPNTARNAIYFQYGMYASTDFVTPDRVVDFSFMVKHTSAAPVLIEPTLLVRDTPYTGQYYVSESYTVPPNEWTPVHVTVYLPPTLEYFSPYIYYTANAAGDLIYFDQMSIQEAGPTWEVSNGSFPQRVTFAGEKVIASEAVAAGELTLTMFDNRDVQNSPIATFEYSPSFFPVKQGVRYLAGVQVETSDDSDVMLRANWINEDGTVLGTVDGPTVASPTIENPVVVDLVAPSGAVELQLEIVAANMSAGAVLYVKDIQVTSVLIEMTGAASVILKQILLVGIDSSDITVQVADPGDMPNKNGLLCSSLRVSGTETTMLDLSQVLNPGDLLCGHASDQATILASGVEIS